MLYWSISVRAFTLDIKSENSVSSNFQTGNCKSFEFTNRLYSFSKYSFNLFVERSWRPVKTSK